MSDDVKSEAATEEDSSQWGVSRLQTWVQHGLFIFAACATGLAAYSFWFFEDAGDAWFDHLRNVRLVTEDVWFVPHKFINLLLPMLMITGAMLVIIQLRMRFFPGTEGTGIPQTIAALHVEDGPIRRRMLSLRIAIGKALLLFLGLFSGMTIGREGPSVHVGACLMYLITKITRFPQHIVQRGLILGGGAAGIAAAFNAPVAGAIFALEEIGRSFEKNNIGTIIRTVLLASLVVILLRGTDYLFYQNVTGTDEKWPIYQWLAVPLIGMTGGFLGGLFARAVVETTRWINPLMRKRRVLIPLSLGAILALLGLISGGETYGSGYAQAQGVLTESESLAWHYAPLKALANYVCLISGIPGGLFDPSFSVGAGLGHTFHPLLQTLFPGLDHTAVVILFMVAYFSGVVQSPITCAVIMVEMTGARFMTIPLLAVAIIAYECSHRVCPKAIYEALAEIFLVSIEQQEVSATTAKN